MTLLHQYQNGNFTTKIYSDGTRIRETEEENFIPEFPENIDIKLTNKCDNTAGCMAHCHEKSNPNGNHGDLELGLNILKSWTPGCEAAFGGGSTLSHPDIFPFLQEVKKTGVISNITVNHFHVNIKQQNNLIQKLLSENLVFGVGVSYLRGLDIKPIKEIYNSNLVFHLIMGVHTTEDLDFIIKNFDKPKILLLGYKTFGNGINYHEKHNTLITENLRGFFGKLHEYFKIKDLTISFDNLGIKQMNLRRFFTEENWNTFYQGDDSFANFYMDLVTKTCAVSSRSKERLLLTNEDTIFSIFSKIKTLPKPE